MTARHIAFAGTDGSGKTTQAQLLVGYLNRGGWTAKLDTSKDDFAYDVLRATTGTTDWTKIREIVGDSTMDLLGALQWARRRSAAIAMTASGVSVVSDRSDLCRLVLARSTGRALPGYQREALLFGGRPDVTVWLDVDPAEALVRIDGRGLDHEPLDHLRALQDRYAELSTEVPLIRVDGTGTPAEVATRVWAAVTTES